MARRVWIGIPADGDGPEKFGNYFRALRAAGLEPCCPDTGGAAAPADCDALLLPGGGDLDPALYGQANTACRNLEPDRDALERDLLEQFLQTGKPVLGICRGMQSLNVFLGGTLFQDIPHHSRVDGADRIHAVSAIPGPLADLFCAAGPVGAESGELMVNSAHHQGLDRLGDGLTAVQWAPDGVVEAVVHRTLPVWGVQWHPERLPGAAGRVLFWGFAELCER